MTALPKRQRAVHAVKALAALFLACAAALVLTACATPPATPSTPLLRLSPAALGRELTLVQQLTIQAAGQSRSLEVALEADADGVRLAFIQLGHTVARLTWDGRTLEQSLSPGWPKVVSAERVLSDLQLVWWPAAAVRAALPPDWQLIDTPFARELQFNGRRVTSMTAAPAGPVTLVQHLDGYTVVIDSPGAVPPFAAAPPAP